MKWLVSNIQLPRQKVVKVKILLNLESQALFLNYVIFIILISLWFYCFIFSDKQWSSNSHGKQPCTTWFTHKKRTESVQIYGTEISLKKKVSMFICVSTHSIVVWSSSPVTGIPQNRCIAATADCMAFSERKSDVRMSCGSKQPQFFNQVCAERRNIIKFCHTPAITIFFYRKTMACDVKLKVN